MGTAGINQVFKVNLPFDNPARVLSPGEAFYIRRGQFWRVKIADPNHGPISAEAWVQSIRRKAEQQPAS
jgi:hypothetical protein